MDLSGTEEWDISGPRYISIQYVSLGCIHFSWHLMRFVDSRRVLQKSIPKKSFSSQSKNRVQSSLEGIQFVELYYCLRSTRGQHRTVQAVLDFHQTAVVQEGWQDGLLGLEAKLNVFRYCLLERSINIHSSTSRNQTTDYLPVLLFDWLLRLRGLVFPLCSHTLIQFEISKH